MDIRLLVIDIDGTLAGTSNTVSRPVKKAIKAAMNRGIQVTLATGRMYRSASRFYESIGANLPLIAYNGAWIQHPLTGEMYQHIPVPQDLALQVIDYLEQPQWQNRLGVHCYLEDKLYVREITARTNSYAQRSGIEAIAVKDLRTILDRSPTKILAMSHELKVIKNLATELPRHFSKSDLHFTQSSETFFETTHYQANKGTAIRYLAEEVLGLKPSQVMAIGDNFNDGEMLQYAGVSVAMANAPTPIQNLATWVTADVEEDGVALAIERFLL